MRIQTTSWLVRGGALAALVAAAFVFPGCNGDYLQIIGSGCSIHVSSNDDGEMSVKVNTPGYALEMESDGPVTFTADESDVATLAPGCEFKLAETIDGVEHVYTVKADRTGPLTRSLTRDDVSVPLDAAGRTWLAAALSRLFTESGFDAEARVARLLAAGGPERVLAEVDRARSDHAKSIYLGTLLGTADLDDEQTGRALASAAQIDSDYDLRNALSTALESQELDGPRFTLLMETAGQIDSDYDKAELLIASAELLPDEAAAREAWLATVGTLDSDYDLRRGLDAGLERAGDDAAFTAQLLGIGMRQLSSDYELRTLLEEVAPRATDPALAAECLKVVRQISSDYDRQTALINLFETASLDTAALFTALDLTAEMGSDHDKGQVLAALAEKVVTSTELSRKYREVAATMSDYQRGAALLALDEAARS